MKIRLTAAVFAPVALAIASPAIAQDTDQQAEADLNFQCAVWASMLAGSPLSNDPEVQTGFTVAIGYFVGQYEALSGRGVDDDWDRAAAASVADDLVGFSEICGNRMDGLGNRLTTLGAEMSQLANSMDGRGKQ